jgi:formylglycine-generating enzyme required for sulfatase activity
MRPSPLAALLGFLTLGIGSMQAQALLSIDTVHVGDAGNAAANVSNVTYDSSTYAGALGYGSVGYDYRLGTTEVTINQYATFLNAVAATPAGNYIENLWDLNMQSDANSAGISRTGTGTLINPYVYTAIAGTGNHPVAYVDWFDAARFTNWLQNGATASASTETGAYSLNGATSGIIARNSGATWWLPSEDEWYKAAYYSPTLNGGTGGYTLYANQSNTLGSNVIGSLNGANYNDGVYATTQNSIKQPNQNYLTDVGAYFESISYYGTFDQGGNVWEWTGTVVSGNQYRIRNGSWIDGNTGYLSAAQSLSAPLTTELFDIGFRVATVAPVPEPATVGLGISALAACLIWRRRRAMTRSAR